MSLEGVLTRAHRIHRDNADQEETQTWSVISELHSPAAATRPTIIASTENTLLADLEYFRPPGVLSRSSHSSRSSRASKASKDALLRLATAQTDMDKLLATQGLEREEDELRLREAELQRKKRLVEAKDELHKAEAAAEILCDGADPERMLALSSRGQKRTTEGNIQHFLQSVKVEKHKETAPPTTRRRTLPKTPAPPPRARSISHDERPLPTLHTSTHGADPKNGAHERHDSSLNPNAPPWPPEDELVTSREDSSSSFSNRLLQVIEQQQQQ